MCDGPTARTTARVRPVSEVLGHASVAITKDVYGHLMEGDRRAATEAITGALLGQRKRAAPKVALKDSEETG
ncbi:hypothetical protein Misp02_04810 [Microtetraspora sp. NBRC 16547]|nr:hypothetical protein Misp02_04810 [Microtetraspora sp. NBRC 16547]